MARRDGAKRPRGRRGDGLRGDGRYGGERADETAAPAPAPEFSRPRRVSALPSDGERLRAKAEPQECEALARRFGVAEMRRMEVDAEIRPSGDGWRVTGLARAQLAQTCVLTLEPVVQTLEERFSRRLQPGAPPPDLADLDPEEEEDPPEPLAETLDPAEMAAEAIALAIDPYPRAPGARFAGAGAAPPGARPIEETAEKPFAKLAELRRSPGPSDGEDDGGPR